MVATTPAAPSTPAGQGRGASRIASDRRGATAVLPENGVSEQLARRHDRPAAASCIGRARPHRGDAHRGRRRFSGHTRDGRYYRARYYHPTLQRFISEDPIGFAGGFHLLRYVDNDPMNYVDPLGQTKGGEQNISVNHDGKLLTRKTPAAKVRKALEEATKRGMGKSHIGALKGLLKVISRGGTLTIIGVMLGELVFPAEAGAESDCLPKACTCGSEQCDIPQPLSGRKWGYM